MEAKSDEATEIPVPHDDTQKSAEKAITAQSDVVLCKTDAVDVSSVDVPLPEVPSVEISVPAASDALMADTVLTLVETPTSQPLLEDVSNVVEKVKVSEQIVNSNELRNIDLDKVSTNTEVQNDVVTPASIAAITVSETIAATEAISTLEDMTEIFEESAKATGAPDTTVESELTDTDIDVPEMSEPTSSNDTDQPDRILLTENSSNIDDDRDDESDDPEDETDDQQLDTSKEDNNIQVLSSSEETDMPSQTDKWSAENAGEECDDDDEMLGDEEFEDEYDEEDENDYESSDEADDEKPRRINTDEIDCVELSDDDDDDEDDDYVKTVPEKKIKSEDVYEGINVEEMASTSDEDEEYGSVNSPDYSDYDDVDRIMSDSVVDRVPVNQNESPSQTAVPEQSNDKGLTGETTNEQNASCVNTISLRVSEAGPKLSDCNENENKKSPELCIVKDTVASQKPTVETPVETSVETPVETPVDAIEDVEMAATKDADVKEVTETVANDRGTQGVPPPTTYAVSGTIEVMDVSVEDAVNEGSTVEATLPEKILNQEPQKLPKLPDVEKADTQIQITPEEHSDKEKSPLIVNGSLDAKNVKPFSPQNSATVKQEAIIDEQIPEQTSDKEQQQQQTTNSKCQNGDDSNLKTDAVIQPQTSRKSESHEVAQPKEIADKSKEPAASTSEKVTTTRKRKASTNSSVDGDIQPPDKRLRMDLESNLSEYNKLIEGFMNETISADPENIQSDIDHLNQEIETLMETARLKEIEWNNILLLKKMKEDMLIRLMRKKTVMDIMSNKINIDSEIYSHFENLQNNESDVASEHSANSNKQSSATRSIVERSEMNSSDLAKERPSINRIHRNIQPKADDANQPGNSNASSASILTNYIHSAGTGTSSSSEHLLQQRLRQESQMQSKLQLGRQGPIKDVKSLIDDFRQRHPEAVPRRGRRMKNVNQHLAGEHGLDRNADLDLRLDRNSFDLTSRPSSNDSMHNNSHTSKSVAAGHLQRHQNELNINVLLDQQNVTTGPLLSSTPLSKQSTSSVEYPEVTLHPIKSGQHAQLKLKNETDTSSNQSQSSSLLHGILTKSARQQKSATTGSTAVANAGILPNAANAGYNNSFSPTLARLLTAPERNLTLAPSVQNAFFNSQPTGINLTKNQLLRSQQQSQQPEISFVPITQILAHQQQSNSLLQQQLQRQRENARFNTKANAFMNMEDEADESDRLVIDEGDQYLSNDMASGGVFVNDESHELPECQGCKKREAQFVCADCQRQWYCSRDCQVKAWDEHSEVCSR